MIENFYLTRFIIIVIIALTVFIVSRKYAIGKTVGWSMYPYLDNDDYFLVKKKCILEEGSVYVFYNDEEVLVKRLTKLNYPLCYFEGDNEKNSIDSRHFGLIHADSIIGKVTKFNELWGKKNEGNSNS